MSNYDSAEQVLLDFLYDKTTHQLSTILNSYVNVYKKNHVNCMET